jgi:hypothetical protein
MIKQRRKTMITIASLFKKGLLAVSVLAIGLAVLPTAGVSAADLNDSSNPPAPIQGAIIRLERAWQRLQMVYERQDNMLDKSDDFIDRAQDLIDKAEAKGWEIGALQAALDAFITVIPQVRATHNPGNGIIASHKGFDNNGKVVDRAKAIETIQSLKQVIKDTRQAVDGTLQALWEALRDFRQSHQSIPGPAN